MSLKSRLKNTSGRGKVLRSILLGGDEARNVKQKQIRVVKCHSSPG